MSRGFVKEGDQEEHPIIPPRAALPNGVNNFVTPNGWKELLQEREELENQRKALPTDNERERRYGAMVIEGTLKLLDERINTARIIDLTTQPKDEVRFGATVEFLNGKRKLTFQIVGVDEANIKKQKIAFTSPIARALVGAKVGEEVDFHRETETVKLKVLSVKYE